MITAGISTASLFLRENTEDALSLLASWRVPVAEVFLTSYCEYEPSFARLLKARQGGVSAHSVHVLGTQFEPQLFAEHPRVKEDAYAVLTRALQAAQIIGATHYSFHGLSRTKRTFREDIPRTGALLKEIVAYCARYSVTLCLENVEWAFYNRAGVFRALKEYCPALKGVLDLKQARLSGCDWREYLSEMGRDIAHVHVSDLDGAGRMCLPGRGVFDFDELIARLKDVGFHGPLLIENYQKDYREVSELRDSYEFLAEKLAKYNE